MMRFYYFAFFTGLLSGRSYNRVQAQSVAIHRRGHGMKLLKALSPFDMEMRCLGREIKLQRILKMQTNVNRDEIVIALSFIYRDD